MVTHFHATLQEKKKTFKKFIFQVLVNIFAPKNAEKFEVYENRSIFCRFRKLTKLLRKQRVTIVIRSLGRAKGCRWRDYKYCKRSCNSCILNRWLSSSALFTIQQWQMQLQYLYPYTHKIFQQHCSKTNVVNRPTIVVSAHYQKFQSLIAAYSGTTIVRNAVQYSCIRKNLRTNSLNVNSRPKTIANL